MTATHPSFLELDVFAVAPVEGEVSKHVRACQQCSAHLAAVRMPAPFPKALASLEVPVSAKPVLSRWLLLIPLTAALVLSVAIAGIAKFMTPRPATDEWTSKGLPAAALWLKRGDTVTAWKGEPLTRDSSVRWEIAPAGFTHLRVIDPQSNEVLLEMKVPGDAPVFTPAWTFDGARSTERIRVVLTRDGAPLPPDWKCSETSRSSWCSEYVLEVSAAEPSGAKKEPR